MKKKISSKKAPAKTISKKPVPKAKAGSIKIAPKKSFGTFQLSKGTGKGKKNVKGKLTLKDLDLQVEFLGKTKPGKKGVGALFELDKFMVGPRPDSGAGDAYSWYQGDIRMAEEPNE